MTVMITSRRVGPPTWACLGCWFEGGEAAMIDHAQETGHPMRMTGFDLEAGDPLPTLAGTHVHAVIVTPADEIIEPAEHRDRQSAGRGWKASSRTDVPIHTVGSARVD